MSPCHKFISCTILVLIVIVSSCLYITRTGPGLFLGFPRNQQVNESTAVVKTSGVGIYSHRKLMLCGSCSNRDISISQSRDYTTSGIPQFIVQIVNTCLDSGCSPSNIRLHCGWFASARIVNPRAFKRVSYDECLVNAGKPLKGTQIIRFTYSNSFMYPLSFKSATFC